MVLVLVLERHGSVLVLERHGSVLVLERHGSGTTWRETSWGPGQEDLEGVGVGLDPGLDQLMDGWI